jgi:hypothetical protein
MDVLEKNSAYATVRVSSAEALAIYNSLHIALEEFDDSDLSTRIGAAASIVEDLARQFGELPMPP